jgi:alanyl-tRNA synthetase
MTFNPIVCMALQDSPASSAVDGLAHSVEFCGGTHLTNTGDAVAFVITGMLYKLMLFVHIS